MIEYNDIKDLIIYCNPLAGSISIEQLINKIKNAVEEQKFFEDIVYSILSNTEMDKADIASLFNLSSTDKIEMYLKMFTEKL